MANIQIKPVRDVGSSRKANLSASYTEIVAVLGEPNVTDLDDPGKVEASWGFTAEGHKPTFVWCYRTSKELCTRWSVDGDTGLLSELFPGRVSKGMFF